MVDNGTEGDGEQDAGEGEPTRPLLSFDSDTVALPHWADAPTGEIPVVGTEGPTSDPAARGGSRLFPQLPDDPNLVDASALSPVPGTDDQGSGGGRDDAFAPPGGGTLDPLATGPIDLSESGLGSTEPPQGPGIAADTSVIRGIGEPEPGADFDRDPESDAREEELRAAAALAGGRQPDFEASPPAGPGATNISGSAALGEPGDSPDEEAAAMSEPPDADEESGSELFADQDPWARLEALPSLDDDVDGGFPAAPDVGALFDEDTASVVAPLGSGAGTSPEAPAHASVDAPAWGGDDDAAPHWREGSNDYEERDAVTEDDRAVLHLDDDTAGRPPGSGRNMPAAVLVGAGLAGAFFGLLYLGPGPALGMAVVALLLAAAEFFQSVRHVGYRPATLLGLTAVAALPLAVYWKGVAAYPLVIALTVVVGLLWFLLGIERDHATANLAITLLGVGWVGVLGSFAALILAMPDGEAVLIGAVIGTVAYDVFGLLIGTMTGQSRLAPHISPNKTYEGLIGGMLCSVLATTLVLFKFPGIHPWQTEMMDALSLAVVVAVMAPIGDLAQSLIKRDLGVKDMGSLLPGHGGVFDRFDGLLLVLPAAYYVSDLVLA